MLTKGSYIADRYEILDKIGTGGMSDVYKAKDHILGREVAVKVLKQEFAEDVSFVTKFRSEAQSAAGLEHANIVNIYDVGSENGMYYIVMEYVEGITLKTYIEKKGQLNFKEAISIAIQVGRGIEAAHNKGIIHRDIKPQNIMLLQDGTIKVTDFGIARMTDNATKTMTEHAIGSVHYIAPEQAKGSKTDGKSDIYSVGVMLYEMITGKLPFEADSAVSVALMQLQSTPKMPREINSSIPLGLEQITMHAMQKIPSERYQSALDMLGDLERFRLNPDVRFDYKYFVDSEPTKFVNTGKKPKPTPAKIEDNPEVEELEKRKERKKPFYVVMTVIVCTVIMAVIFCVAGLFKGCASAQSTDVEVPDFVGMNIVDANENNEYNFKFEIKHCL